MEKKLLAKGTGNRGSTFVLVYNDKGEFITYFEGIGETKDETAYYQGNYFLNPKLAVKDLKKRLEKGNNKYEIDWKTPKEEILNMDGDGLVDFFSYKKD